MIGFLKRLVVLFSFFLCVFQEGFSEEWMPDGMIVDKRGNVIHMVEMPDDFTGPKKTLTTLAYMAELEKGQTIVNLSNICVAAAMLFHNPCSACIG